MQTLASRCVPVRMAVFMLLLPGIPSWGHGILESSSSSPELPTRPAGTRLYLLRHTDRIDFADHQWVGSSGSERVRLHFTLIHAQLQMPR